VGEAAPDILASLSEMTVPQLTEVIQRAEAVRTEKVEAEKFAVIERVKAELSAYSVSQADLFPVARRGRQAGSQTRAAPVAKYRNPANPSETWSGRGRIARWLQVLEAEGHKRDEYLIDKPDSAAE